MSIPPALMPDVSVLIAIGVVCGIAGFVAGVEWYDRKLRREGKLIPKSVVDELSRAVDNLGRPMQQGRRIIHD